MLQATVFHESRRLTADEAYDATEKDSPPRADSLAP
jgi:hypothetical protein